MALPIKFTRGREIKSMDFTGFLYYDQYALGIFYLLLFVFTFQDPMNMVDGLSFYAELTHSTDTTPSSIVAFS